MFRLCIQCKGYLKMYKSIRVSEFLHRIKEPVELQPEQEYSLVTIKVNHRGVVLRNKTKGKLIGSKMHRISKGQFILSGIDARHGAFGIVPDELDGAIVTNDFWYFDIDETKVKRDFFYWLTNTPIFLNACIKSSQGVTQRVRLQAKLFFDFEFRFPPLEEQENFLKKIQHADQYLSSLRVELNNQEKYVSQLKQAILQEAIAGQLTAEWRTQNPIQKGNPDTDAAALLAKIKTEKQRLIADGKLKKEKPLAEIAIDEIPFSIPNNWVWCRLGEICLKIHYGFNASAKPNTTGVRLLRITDIQNNKVNWKNVPSCDYSDADLDRYLLNENDIVIARTGGTIGKTFLVENISEKSLFASYLIRAIPSKIISAYFLKLFMESPIYWKQLYDAAWGSGQPNVNATSLTNLNLPLPPLAEQKAIVEKVDKLMNIINQLEQQIKHRKQLAEDLMQTVLREAFE